MSPQRGVLLCLSRTKLLSMNSQQSLLSPVGLSSALYAFPPEVDPPSADTSYTKLFICRRTLLSPVGLSSGSSAFTSLFGMGRGGTHLSKTPTNKKLCMSLFGTCLPAVGWEAAQFTPGEPRPKGAGGGTHTAKSLGNR